MADSLDECLLKVKVWKVSMETKGLRFNKKKTMLMVSGPGLDILRDSGAFPCARPVRIRNRIGPPHPLECRKRRLNGDL
jgi:hypothetical protein